MHQCLRCGKVFERSTRSLLKGCPSCGGTKFFYTREALGEDERKTILEEANRDLKGLVEGVIRGGGFFSKNQKTSFLVGDFGADKGRFIELTGPTTGSDMGPDMGGMDNAKNRIEKPHTPESNLKPHIGEDVLAGGYREKPKKEKYAVEGVEDAPSGIIDVVRSGVYLIDVDSLMRERAIVIKREESYFIHLPSAFERRKR